MKPDFARCRTVYLLLTSDAAFKLAFKVNEYLAEGWALYGSPSITSYEKYSVPVGTKYVEVTYIQALTREEKRT